MAVSFDASYFRRFYESRRSRVYGKEQVDSLARGVSQRHRRDSSQPRSGHTGTPRNARD